LKIEGQIDACDDGKSNPQGRRFSIRRLSGVSSGNVTMGREILARRDFGQE
jgi:hypothetical protein